MKAVIGMGLAVAVVAGWAVLGGGDPAPERVGYFKSEGGNRVMAYVAPGGMSDEQARAALAGAMHSKGQLTFAVIYRPGRQHPGNRLTAAPDYLTAAAMLDKPPYDGWAWGAVINVAGEVQFEKR